MNTFATGWYAILSQKELCRLNTPLSIKRFGLDLVLWRTNENKVIALLDRCPHRSAKLSLGKLNNNHITCPFHGFQFDEEGRCAFAPEFNKAIPGLTVKKFITHEAFGMIWLFYGNTPTPFNIPRLEQINHEFKKQVTQTSKEWNVHITRAIENQLDYTHLPFIHKNTIGRSYKFPSEPRVESNENSLAVYFNNQQKTPSFTFMMPNAWNLSISEKMQLVVYFVPIDDSHTKFYVTAYRKFLWIPGLNWLFNYLFNLTNLIILKQDQCVVESQGKEPSYLNQTELLMRHDLAIKQFRGMWQKQL